jgi:hypothetical protein
LDRDFLPDSSPQAWSAEVTTALGISSAFALKQGQTLPGKRFYEVIDGAIRVRYLELMLDSGPLVCRFAGGADRQVECPGPGRLPNLKYHLCTELGGHPSSDVLVRVNKLLQKIRFGLGLLSRRNYVFSEDLTRLGRYQLTRRIE